MRSLRVAEFLIISIQNLVTRSKLRVFCSLKTMPPYPLGFLPRWKGNLDNMQVQFLSGVPVPWCNWSALQVLILKDKIRILMGLPFSLGWRWRKTHIKVHHISIEECQFVPLPPVVGWCRRRWQLAPEAVDMKIEEALSLKIGDVVTQTKTGNSFLVLSVINESRDPPEYLLKNIDKN